MHTSLRYKITKWSVIRGLFTSVHSGYYIANVKSPQTCSFMELARLESFHSNRYDEVRWIKFQRGKIFLRLDWSWNQGSCTLFTTHNDRHWRFPFGSDSNRKKLLFRHRHIYQKNYPSQRTRRSTGNPDQPASVHKINWKSVHALDSLKKLWGRKLWNKCPH